MKSIRRLVINVYLSILLAFTLFSFLFILATINLRNTSSAINNNDIIVPLPVSSLVNDTLNVNLNNHSKELSQKVEWKVRPDGTVMHHGDSLVLDRNYSMLINNPTKCNQLHNNSQSFLVVILSSVNNFERRQIIRETWALDVMQQIGNFKVIFIVGLTNSTEIQERIKFENLIYEDIVQINTEDSFYNLTYKSIHMLYWYINFCPNAKFLFKTDDDIYLHIPNVFQLFSKQTNNTQVILCRRNRSRKILRNSNIKDLFFYSSKTQKSQDRQQVEQSKKKFKKYIVDYKQLPGNLYPDYCSGFGYAMTYPVVERLFKASQTIPYIGIEDVFITGFCRQKANIAIVDHREYFRLNPIIHPIESRCVFDKTVRINSQEMLATGDMRTLWTHINTQGYYCKYNSTI